MKEQDKSVSLCFTCRLVFWKKLSSFIEEGSSECLLSTFENFLEAFLGMGTVRAQWETPSTRSSFVTLPTVNNVHNVLVLQSRWDYSTASTFMSGTDNGKRVSLASIHSGKKTTLSCQVYMSAPFFSNTLSLNELGSRL